MLWIISAGHNLDRAELDLEESSENPPSSFRPVVVTCTCADDHACGDVMSSSARCPRLVPALLPPDDGFQHTLSRIYSVVVLQVILLCRSRVPALVAEFALPASRPGREFRLLYPEHYPLNTIGG